MCWNKFILSTLSDERLILLDALVVGWNCEIFSWKILNTMISYNDFYNGKEFLKYTVENFFTSGAYNNI